MQRKIRIILVLGIALRIVLSLITYHSDLAPYLFAGQTMAKGNLGNFYDYLWQLPDSSPERELYPANLFNYPPAVYFTLGPVERIFALPFGNLAQSFVYDIRSVLGTPILGFLLLSLKLPFLVFDVAMAYLLLKFFDSPRDKVLAFVLWMFNPVAIYATYMVGQFDIIPTFLFMLVLLRVKRGDLDKKSLIPEALLLGLGASYKIFPILFVIPLLLLKDKWSDRIKIAVASVLPYVLFILPFLGSRGFRATALVAGQTIKSLYSAIAVSGGESIFLYPAAVIFFFVVFYFARIKKEDLWHAFFILLLVFFVFTHYHPQWFLWITPLFVIDLVSSKLRHWVLVGLSLVSFVALVTFFDPGLSIGLFAPISPLLYNSPGLWERLGVNLDVNFARSMFQTLFVGVALYYLYKYFPKLRHDD